MTITYQINATDSDEAPTWMALCLTATPARQGSGRCAWTVTVTDEQRDALEAALDADDSVIRYESDDVVDCQCGEWSGERCQWSGPRSATVLVEYMPERHRASHTAAGNRGSRPANGSVRIRCEASCADRMVEHDGEWCEIVGDPRIAAPTGPALRANADTSHESAEEMWESLGWASDYDDRAGGGQIAHPVCTVEQLDTMTDAEILRSICGEWVVLEAGLVVDTCASEPEAEEIAAEANAETDEEMGEDTVGDGAASVAHRWTVGESERGAYESAIAYARSSLADMRSIESSLSAAVEAYEDGDLATCIEALDAASREESEYGDDPAASALREALIVE